MALAPPPLPTRFPCWVRAVYSWGGESKRDLGFIEGDLIECLNAGDGSWWTGRLFRDRRAIGLFPSNFVQVLPDKFRPTTRCTSPLPPIASGNTPSPAAAKSFRKPFEAYAKAPHYTAAKVPIKYKDGVKVDIPPPARHRENSAASFQSVRENSAEGRAGEHGPANGRGSVHVQARASNGNMANNDGGWRDGHRDHSGQANGQRYTNGMTGGNGMNYGSRAPSPAPPAHYGSRAPSPAPSFGYTPAAHQNYSRAPSPQPPMTPTTPMTPTYVRRPSHQPAPQEFEALESPPPPAPPPHRQAIVRHGSNASYNNDPFVANNSHFSRHNSNASYASYNSNNNNSSSQNQPSGYHTPRAPSPCPPSPGGGAGITPSPLREAMDDVMEQLDALSASRGGNPEAEVDTNFDPWSPESFDLVHQRSRRKEREQHYRPRTSLGIAEAEEEDEGYETYSGSGISSGQQRSRGGQGNDYRPYRPPEPPQLSNYVERMESRMRSMNQRQDSGVAHMESEDDDNPPPPPPKRKQPYARPQSSMDLLRHQTRQQPPQQPQREETEAEAAVDPEPARALRTRKSAYEMGREMLGRTFTTKTNSTSASSGTRSTATTSTNRSLMSGVSAGGISATSAGSLARKNISRAQSALGMRDLALDAMDRPETPFSGVTYHSSHATNAEPAAARSRTPAATTSYFPPMDDVIGGIGGLVQPKAKKQNFIKRILESAKTGVASSRGSIATSGGAGGLSMLSSPMSRSTTNLVSMVSGSFLTSPGKHRDTLAKDMGMNAGIDWVQVRRDVNRSNSLSKNERQERRERSQMLDYAALDPVEELWSSVDGDEGADGMPIRDPTNYAAINYSQVDKNSRFITNLPATTTPVTLTTTYVCRPYRSDVQRLRAIFSWVAEKIFWEEDLEVSSPGGRGRVDTHRVVQTKRACAEEYAALVMEMCSAVGLPCEVIRGYLKTPGEVADVGIMPRPNHWWNAVLVDGREWRIIDCCLASPSNPRRSLYSTLGSSASSPAGGGGASHSIPPSAPDAWWFLTRPTEACWTHIPEHHAHQHMCPAVAHDTLLQLPCALAPYFRHRLALVDYDTGLMRIEDLEMVHVKLNVPDDVEIAAEVEVRAYARDADGDVFESGEVVRKRALAQAEWFGGVKRYTIKALLPGDEGVGVLKVYAGKRGLMHSIKDIPHPLALALPVVHSGENPAYEFVTRHPTPHAQRHDIYVAQPQCQRLALNNTFVFAIRQHPSCLDRPLNVPGNSAAGDDTASIAAGSIFPGAPSPIPFARPGSAMSVTSSSAAGSNPSTSTASGGGGGHGSKKPAKLAIQTPGGKILRLMRKEERRGGAIATGDDETSDGGMWETIIKCSEKGVWRGLVLADRTARWCVFAEWICVG